MSTMTSPARATEHEATAAVEALEAAFTRLGLVLKRNVLQLAAGVHPEMRQAGWAVLGTVLRASRDGTPMTVGEIVTTTGMDKSVVSRQLRSLKDWGLVTMRRDDADARVVVVDPTDEARKRFEAVRARRREIYAELLLDWSTADVAQLERMLGRLADAVED